MQRDQIIFIWWHIWWHSHFFTRPLLTSESSLLSLVVYTVWRSSVPKLVWHFQRCSVFVQLFTSQWISVIKDNTHGISCLHSQQHTIIPSFVSTVKRLPVIKPVVSNSILCTHACLSLSRNSLWAKSVSCFLECQCLEQHPLYRRSINILTNLVVIATFPPFLFLPLPCLPASSKIYGLLYFNHCCYICI